MVHQLMAVAVLRPWEASKVVVSGSKRTGFQVTKGGSAMLRECSAATCGFYEVGVSGEGSSMELDGCTLQQNGQHGAVSTSEAVVEVRDCSSPGNGEEGYCTVGQAQMTVSNSSSDGDHGGCGVDEAGQLIMHEVTVDGVLQSGQLP